MGFILFVLAIISLVYSQPAFQTWTAQTIVTSSAMGSGYFDATVKYDWGAGMMEVDFGATANNYKEFYAFNTGLGYNGAATNTLGQFANQYLYKSSDTCPCEILSLEAGMPAWWPAATLAIEPNNNIQYYSSSNPADTGLPNYKPQPVTAWYTNVNFKVQINSGTPAQYKSYVIANNFWVDNNNAPAGFTLNDPDGNQRLFTITSLTAGSTGSLGLTVPSLNCPCGKFVDIALSLDRSGSISVAQWDQEYAFVKSFITAFTYGPTAANLGIVNWNAAQWTTIDLASGTSANAVDSAVNNMACCTPPPPAPSCCCCGTPIGGGIWAGASMLANGRPTATKVLVVLTDGCQNHIWDPTISPPATACNCASEKACATNIPCISDITKWVGWSQTNVPGIKIVAIGVGTNLTICAAQLLLAAGGDPTNVYNPQSWTSLTSLVQTISATSCTANSVPCINCCGLCNCGQCIPAPKCFNADLCHVGTFDPTTNCCRSDAIPCTPPVCQTGSCDPLKGCVYAPVTCKVSKDVCTEWICNSTFPVCTQVPVPVPPPSCNPNVVVPECLNDTDCNAGDPCLVYKCLNTTGNLKCYNSPKVCGTSDQCTSYYCQPGVGCSNTTYPCDDHNNCTVDACDPKTGCSYTPVPPCPIPDDTCKKTYCDPVLGCVIVPINCADYGFVPSQINCTVPNCNKTCYNQYVCITGPPTSAESFPQQTIILSAALGTAAIVGIVIGAVVLVAGLGTAAGVAIAGAAGAGGVALVTSNPVYVASAASGVNVLFKNQE